MGECLLNLIDCQNSAGIPNVFPRSLCCPSEEEHNINVQVGGIELFGRQCNAGLPAKRLQSNLCRDKSYAWAMCRLPTDIGFEHCTRSHFVGERYNCMTSNIAESLNNVLTMARDYPVISLLETLRTTLVTWFALRREAAQVEGNLLPPKVNEMVIENFKKGAGYVVVKIGDSFYEVRDRQDSAFAVNLWERTCTCRKFQLLTIPCSHAIATAIKEGIRVETMVGIYHIVPYLRLAYKGLIMPVPDMDTLTPPPSDVGGGKLALPYVRRLPGRPRKRRLFYRGEFKVMIDIVYIDIIFVNASIH